MTKKATKQHKWTAEQRKFFKDNVKGTRFKKLQEMINKKFNLQLTINQITGFASRNNLTNGIDMSFKKDLIPWNKGKKGLRFPGSEKGWFVKGQDPVNYRPVGSERITRDGYTEIKTANPNIWKLKQRLIWEDAHGELPKNHTVVFADGNKENLEIDNLICLSREELLKMNQYGLFFDDAELTMAGLNILKLNIRITDIEIYGGDKEEFQKYVEIAQRKGLGEQTFIARLKRGWSLKDAMYRPLHYVPKRERSVSN